MKNFLLVIVLLIPFLFYSCKSAEPIKEERRKQIKAELREMVTIDQVAAKVRTGKYKAYTEGQWQTFKDSVFQTNQKTIENYFLQYGYLGYNQVGKEGSNHFWLLVQHCDHDPAFQRRVLKAMRKAVKKKNANPENYAYLFDRVQVNAGEKQLFGTQVDYLVRTTGRAIPKIGLLDSARVDQLRQEHNLGTLKDYLNLMTQMHFQMNKASYTAKGITKPDLY
ncbi:DUF6624 domain-containing protein [Sphingobacterium deserti]|uniref:Lipoprotein n=1 Tax=Sphingobacterium deserti TaxID=1229276 RepID=A0A0B8T4G6_9SPHI|nr:DUF6624 domain-containing protein [Sphingobacterium deserti]KGE14643.1 hypothetical protein DI53_1672 [Sphingobacterium deserti]